MRLRSGKIINAALAMPASAPAKSLGCLYCSLRFPHAVTALNHECEEHPNCNQCKERFSGRAELQNHQQITGHCYCRECDAYFPTVRKHLNHARETTHTTPYHCCDCGREYTNQETLSYHCCECDELFRTKKFLRRHFSGKKHIGKIGVPMSMSSPNLPHKCNMCVETFHNKKQLERHMTNHRAPRNIPCLTGGDCQKKFAVPSALLNHLESGCCSSGITRAKMHQLVIDHDPNRYITSFNGLSSSHSSEYIPASQSLSHLVESSSENSSTEQFTPLSLDPDDDHSLSEWFGIGRELQALASSGSDWSIIDGAVATPTFSDSASEWSFVSEELIHVSSDTVALETDLGASSHLGSLSQKWHCRLCGPNRKPFRSMRAYQAHVDSAAHAPKIFHCPLSFLPNAKSLDLSKTKEFSTLGGLTQHLESGRCEGGLELYTKAISFVEEQLKVLGFSGLMLLSN